MWATINLNACCLQVNDFLIAITSIIIRWACIGARLQTRQNYTLFSYRLTVKTPRKPSHAIVSYEHNKLRYFHNKTRLKKCSNITKLTSFSRSTSAVKTAHSIYTSGPIEASRPCTIIDINAAVQPCPTVHTDAGKSANAIGASCSVLTWRGPICALVNVLQFEFFSDF